MDPVYSNLDLVIADLSIKAVFISAVLLILLSIFSVKHKNAKESVKKILFFSFVTIAIGCTLFLAGATIYLNVVSVSKGPVHHHADFQIWKCGEELNLKDPQGLSSKVGTPTLHEHDDKRIHLEGVIVNELDASLGNFFRVLGGSIETDQMSFPGNDGVITMSSGDECGGSAETKLQVFLYKVEGDLFEQSKLANPRDYIISSDQNVPPGDCIIIELDSLKNRTDKLCTTFEAAVTTDKLKEIEYDGN